MRRPAPRLTDSSPPRKDRTRGVLATLAVVLLLLANVQVALYVARGRSEKAPAPSEADVERLLNAGDLTLVAAMIAAGQRAEPHSPRWACLEARLMMARGWYRQDANHLKPWMDRGQADEALRVAYRHALLLSDPARLVREAQANPGDVADDQLLDAWLSAELTRHAGHPEALRTALVPIERALKDTVARRGKGAADLEVTLGILYLARGDLEKSRGALESAEAHGLGQDARSVDGIISMAYVALRQNDMKTARARLDQALRYAMADTGSDFALTLGCTEQFLFYRMVYFDAAPTDNELELLELRYARLRREGVRSPNPGETNLAMLKALREARKAGDVDAQLEMTTGDENTLDLNPEDWILCIFAKTVHSGLMRHSRLIFAGDSYRAIGDIPMAARAYREALQIFPGNRLTIDRLRGVR